MQDAQGWLLLLCLGGLCGALGQGARVIVGFKKLNDVTSSQSAGIGDLIEGGRLFLSFGIGFVVGALAATQILKNPAVISLQQVMQIAATGYAGTDFLEGFISRQFASSDVPAGQGAIGTGATASTAGVVDADGYAG